MSTTERTPGETLMAAAQKLEALDEAAGTGETWQVFGPNLAALVGGCTCGAPRDVHGHESGCGLEQIATFSTYADGSSPEADLAAALRPIAAPLAAHFRAGARAYRYDYPGLIEVARAILGEVTP